MVTFLPKARNLPQASKLLFAILCKNMAINIDSVVSDLQILLDIYIVVLTAGSRPNEIKVNARFLWEYLSSALPRPVVKCGVNFVKQMSR